MTSMKKAMSKVAGEESPLDRLETVASFAGQQLAGAANRLFARLITGADYVADNWMMIASKIQQAGVLAGLGQRRGTGQHLGLSHSGSQ